MSSTLIARWASITACIAALLPLYASQAATFTVVNLDASNVGLNDTSAFTAVGGNNASTLGEARRNVIAEAGRQWGLRLNSSQTIVMEAQFSTQTCTSTSGVLASAGPKSFYTQSSNPNVLLPAALIDALTNNNVNSNNDISITVNSAVGTGSGCLNGKSFYLGLDHNNGSNIDLLNVLLHEIGHGLGFISMTDSSGAPYVAGKFSSFDQFVYAESLAKFWPAMTNAERASATTTPGGVTFNGSNVNSNVSGFTTTTGLNTLGNRLRLYTPTTYSSGSSVSHWDTAATPNLLMEPFITANALGSTDLTGCVLRDIGWNNAYCPEAAPTAQSKTVTTNKNVALSITLNGNATDSSRSLTYTIGSNPAHGSLIAPATLTSSSGVVFTYTPDTNFSGSDSFTFLVSDGVRTSSAATITVGVTNTNNAPSAGSLSLSTSANTAVAVTLSGSDADGDALSYTIVTSPSHGTLTGNAPNLTYTPTTSYVGSDSFTYFVRDGSVNSNTATVNIQVNAAASSSSNTDANNSNSGSSGGGSMSMWWLLALLAACIARLRISIDVGNIRSGN